MAEITLETPRGPVVVHDNNNDDTLQIGRGARDRITTSDGTPIPENDPRLVALREALHVTTLGGIHLSPAAIYLGRMQQAEYAAERGDLGGVEKFLSEATVPVRYIGRGVSFDGERANLIRRRALQGVLQEAETALTGRYPDLGLGRQQQREPTNRNPQACLALLSAAMRFCRTYYIEDAAFTAGVTRMATIALSERLNHAYAGDGTGTGGFINGGISVVREELIRRFGTNGVSPDELDRFREEFGVTDPQLAAGITELREIMVRCGTYTRPTRPR